MASTLDESLVDGVTPSPITKLREPFSPNERLRTYFASQSEEWSRLLHVKRKGWNDRSADLFFRKKPERPKYQWLSVYKDIAREMHQATGAFDSPGSSSRVLDICLAPGGFAKFILELQGDSTICGVTLPRTQDGYDVVVPFGPFDPRVQILFADVTACGLDYGLTAVECTKFSTKDLTLTTRRPFFGHSFDVVVCDGHIENVQKKVGAGKWRRAQRRDDDDEDDPAIGRGKATSLMYAQLILGMQRLKPGGTLVMLLFRAENWFSLQLINTFDQIAEIQLFKPAHRFAAKPSFYLVAKNVQTRSETALHAIEDWKIAWRWATLRNNPRYPYIPFRADPTDVEKFLEERGERMVELAEPIWKIQADGLEHMLGCAPISSKTAGNVPG